MKKIFFAVTGMAVILGGLFIGSAQADTMVQNFSYGPQSTNWSDTINVNQFDSSLGTLTGVSILLNGNVTGTIKVENLSTSSGATITSDLTATITLTSSVGNLAEVIPVYNDTFNASIFDGIIDFSGTSGETLDNLTGTDSITEYYTSGDSQFAQFLGSGTLSLDLGAVGHSTASGGGSTISSFSTNATGNVTVTYTYTSSVPEPATMLLFGVGIIGLTGYIRKRK